MRAALLLMTDLELVPDVLQLYGQTYFTRTNVFSTHRVHPSLHRLYGMLNYLTANKYLLDEKYCDPTADELT